MCFMANEYIEPQIADEDIIVYKEGIIVDNYFYPSATGYEYIIDGENPIIDLHVDSDDDILMIINEGYHSYDATLVEPDDYLYDTVECIIPKGSTYYYYGNLYVSSNIVIKQKIDKCTFLSTKEN